MPGQYVRAKISVVSGILSAIVPVVSVLLGAAITYWLNVRTRRKTFVEDQLNGAIAAVAIADASRHYLRSVARPEALSDRQYRELLADIAKAAVENHTKRAGEAREALARVMQYDPKVRAFYEDAQAVTDRPIEIIDHLIELKAERTRSVRMWAVRSRPPA